MGKGLAILGVPGVMGRPKAFSPLDVPGLALWLDASDSTTLFQDSAGTTPATEDEHPIGKWADKSGNNYHATQAGDNAKRPVLKLNIQNSKPVVRAVSTDHLAFADGGLALFQNVSYATIFAVYNPGQTSAVQRALLQWSNAADATKARVTIREGITAERFAIYARRLDADTAASATSDTNHGGAATVLTAVMSWAAGAFALRENGTQTAAGSFAASGATQDAASMRGRLFIATDEQYPSIGDIGELLVYVTASAMSAAQINQVETYLSQKWGISFLNSGGSPAAWTWFNNPRGVRVGDYSVWGGIVSPGNVVAHVYDHGGGYLLDPVTLHAALQKDDHASPAFLVRASDSRIMAFYTRHNDNANYYLRVSVNANDPRTWQDEVDLYTELGSGAYYTYANPVQLTGETNDPIYLFYRLMHNMWCAKSEDDGVNWTSYQLLANGAKRPYLHVVANGTERIDIVCSTGHPNEITCSIYHGYYQGGNWYQSDGTLVGAVGDAPFAPNEFALVYDGTTTNAWNHDIAIDGNGNPVIVFATFPTPASDHRYNYARWTGEAWDVHQIATAGGPLYAAETYYSGGAVLDPLNVTTVFCSRQVDGIWHIYKEVTADGGATWTETAMTTDANNSIRPFVIRGHGGTRQVVYMRGTYTSYTNFATRAHIIDG